MRQRITFLHAPRDAIDPTALQVTDSSLQGPVLPAVREDRLTLALDELPNELRQVLQKGDELHIRWVSPHAYDTISPLYARLPPGFHLFYTPSVESANQNDDRRLCLKLQEAFGPGLTSCKTAQSSFTALPKDRFTHSTAYQYYSPLDSLSPFVAYATNTLCPPAATTSPEGSSCAARIDRLATASTLDISFDAAGSSRDALKVTAQWNLQDQPLVVTSSLDPSKHRVEIGVLASDPAQRGLAPHELGIAGLLTVLGQDKKPSTTVFKFPARHRRLPGAVPIFTADFLQPTGLHPTLQLKLSQEAIQPPHRPRSDDESNQCSLHAYLTLPRTVFADKYQLSDPLFLASKNLSALEYISQPVDLEAPDYVMDLWGSAVLLELLPPSSSSSQWTAEVPLHLRYLAPTPGGYQDIEVPYPAIFWACSSSDKIPPSPFDKVRLGYDGLFPADTVFWHVDPYGKGAGGQQEQRLTSGLRVPVLDTDKAGWVRAGTTAVVALGFGWLVWKLAQVYLATGYGPTKQMEGLEGKRKKGAEDKKTQ